MKMTHVTEDNLATLQSIVLNVDCEASTRLKDYILDYDLFLNNLPQFHSVCKDTALKKLQKIRKKNKSSEDTNFSLCIFCQEHSCETLNNFAEKGFASFKNDLSNLDEMMIDKLRKCLNFDRIKNIVEIESNKEEFSPVKLKYHKNCRHKTRIKNRPRKNLKTLTSEPEKREENVESTPDEDIFELLAMREKKMKS
ncbi:unnamed protein product [Meganyctiphanes norvegica]|uniref:Uncharacterized protein n=1 Tax=Meganyctiphanes norvegica TaxID=48144 RepID=A0AAV2Q0Y7_MEGNR